MPERERFGDFLLHERLAVGGMGELYLATRAERRSPPFALKIMARSYRENAEFVAMFQDEARIGMRLSHSNIVGVQEVGFADFTAYIVMEYVHGENLRHVLRVMDKLGERIPPALAVKLAIDVLRGLDHAHKAVDEQGQKLHLVHRDLSPDNILVSYEGQVKLLDFGIAKAEGRTTTTQVGVVKGKPQYMSPEQAKARIVDARSDLFSAAVVLRELLTGERRFPDDDLRWESARNWMPRSTPGIPPELDAILLRALEPEAAHRYQTADELASDLTRLARSGALPRAKESLPALLTRLFPDASARKFDSTDVTILKPPRWETEEQESTRAVLGQAGPIARNLATSSATVPMAPMFGSIDAGPTIPPPPTEIPLAPPAAAPLAPPLAPPPLAPAVARPAREISRAPRGATPIPRQVPPDEDPTAPAADLASMATSPGVIVATPTASRPEQLPDRNTARSPRTDAERNTTRSPRVPDPWMDRRRALGAIAVLVPATLAGVFALWRLWPDTGESEPAATPTPAPKPVRTATPRPKATRRPLPKKTPTKRPTR